MLVYPKPLTSTGNNLHDIINHCNINRKGTRSYKIWLEYINIIIIIIIIIIISQFNEIYIMRDTQTYT
jgi:hypothetical protein